VKWHAAASRRSTRAILVRAGSAPVGAAAPYLNVFIAPRTLATSGRRPGVRAKRAARGVAGRQLLTGARNGSPIAAIIK